MRVAGKLEICDRSDSRRDRGHTSVDGPNAFVYIVLTDRELRDVGSFVYT